jgi:enamidase
LLDRAQHAPGKDMLASIAQGNLPGIAMTVIDGIVRSHRSRNTPPAEKLAELLKSPPTAMGGGH